jgi:small subunit ribosomal protein S16
MAVVIRLRRTGRRNRPCYRITVADSRFPRDGRLVETLGLYDPLAAQAEQQVRFDVERAKYWVGQGALPSETVASIFKRFQVYEGMPPRKPRKRAGRGRKTATRETRHKVKAERLARKETRRNERAAARKAAAAASESAATEA